MDPEVTLRDFLEALAEGDRQAAIESASNLVDWLRRGGAVPRDFAHSLLKKVAP